MAKSLEYCTVEKHGHLTIVTINRPEVMNSLHYEGDLELDAVWNDFQQDREQWVAIVTGAGERAFSTGNDLKAQAKVSGRRQFPPGGFAGLSTRFDLDKPVIAAVNGMAMGGGFELALACDLVIADETALFALPEPKVGLAALAGGVQYLPKAIGLPRAMGILLTGRRVSAREGYELGFVTAVTEKGKSLDAVVEMARRAGTKRLWLVTSNDNLDALRFYQRRGWRLAALRPGAVVEARRLKPSIPAQGAYGIPLTDEIELEYIV